MPLVDGDQPDQPNTNSAPTSPSWWTRLVNRSARFLEERRSKRAVETLQDRAARRTANATVAIAWLAIVTGVIGFAQWRVLHHTVTEMQNEQRAWVSIKSATFTTPLVFDRNGATVWFKLHLKNVGKTPARYVWADPVFVVRDLTNAAVDIQNENCKKLSSRATDKNGAGFNIFPDDEIDLPLQAVMKPSEVKKLSSVARSGKGTAVIAGCVDYLSGDAAKHGQTGFIYEVDKKSERPGGFLLDPNGGNIPVSELIFQINPGLVAIVN